MTRECLPNRRAAGLRATTNIAWKQCDGGRSTSTIYPTLKGRRVTRSGMRFRLVQDCVVRAISVACGIQYDDAFRFLDAEPCGAVWDYVLKIEGKTINGWHIDLLRRWPSRITRFEFPELFPPADSCAASTGRTAWSPT